MAVVYNRASLLPCSALFLVAATGSDGFQGAVNTKESNKGQGRVPHHQSDVQNKAACLQNQHPQNLSTKGAKSWLLAFWGKTQKPRSSSSVRQRMIGIQQTSIPNSLRVFLPNLPSLLSQNCSSYLVARTWPVWGGPDVQDYATVSDVAVC